MAPEPSGKIGQGGRWPKRRSNTAESGLLHECQPNRQSTIPLNGLSRWMTFGPNPGKQARLTAYGFIMKYEHGLANVR